MSVLPRHSKTDSEWTLRYRLNTPAQLDFGAVPPALSMEHNKVPPSTKAKARRQTLPLGGSYSECPLEAFLPKIERTGAEKPPVPRDRRDANSASGCWRDPLDRNTCSLLDWRIGSRQDGSPPQLMGVNAEALREGVEQRLGFPYFELTAKSQFT